MAGKALGLMCLPLTCINFGCSYLSFTNMQHNGLWYRSFSTNVTKHYIIRQMTKNSKEHSAKSWTNVGWHLTLLKVKERIFSLLNVNIVWSQNIYLIPTNLWTPPGTSSVLGHRHTGLNWLPLQTVEVGKPSTDDWLCLSSHRLLNQLNFSSLFLQV